MTVASYAQRMRRSARLAAVWHARGALLAAAVNRTPPAPSQFAAFGARSRILVPARIANPQFIRIGANVLIHEGGWFSVEHVHEGPPPRLTVGDGAQLGRNCLIACTGSVTIGAGVLTSDGVVIADSYHAYDQPAVPIARQGMSAARPVVIGAGAFLGAHAIVLPGVSVGDNAYVGAGAVVTGDVPARSVVAGNPARVIRQWDDTTETWSRLT
jgi:acetyltransferase-like isoleucine patch superfamily enzyme